MKLRQAEGTAEPVSRIERRAYEWAMKMADDPERYRAGLERWLGSTPERIAVYNRVAQEMRLATWSAARLDLPRELSGPTRRAPFFGSSRAFAMAGVAATILAGSAAYLAFLAPHRTSERIAAETNASAQSYSTRPDEMRRTRLPDGSIVTLDKDTAFTIRFTTGRRTIDLDRGRIRFEVAHDVSRPFVVLADGGSITAIGTVFDVDVHNRVRVHLITGAVEVAVPASSSAAARKPVRLRQGQQLAFGPTPGDPAPLPQIARPSDARWVSGTMSFEDMPVSDIIAQTNSYAKEKIAVADPGLLRKEMFVDLDIRDTEQVARKLAILLNLEVDRSQRGELILRQR